MSTILASARPKHAFKIAFDQLKPYRLRLLGVLVLGLVTAICGLIGPWAVGVVVDKLLITPDFRQVLGYCLLIVVGGIIAALGTWWSNVLLARVLEPAIANLRESVLDAALTLDSDTVERADGHPSWFHGDCLSRRHDRGGLAFRADRVNRYPLVLDNFARLLAQVGSYVYPRARSFWCSYATPAGCCGRCFNLARLPRGTGGACAHQPGFRQGAGYFDCGIPICYLGLFPQ